MLRDRLNQAGVVNVGRKHVGTLMRKMGVEALYRKPKTTKRYPEHKVYPYLLRGLPITRANQVWAMDITYLPMARGFVQLTVVMDWYSRRALSHRVSISMDAQSVRPAVGIAALVVVHLSIPVENSPKVPTENSPPVD